MNLNRKKIIFSLGVFIGLLGLVMLVGRSYGAYKNVIAVVAAKNDLLSAFETKDLSRIKPALKNTRKATDRIAKDVDFFSFAAVFPKIKNEERIIRQIISKTDYLVDAGEVAVKIAEDASINFNAEDLSVLDDAELLKKIDAVFMINKSETTRLVIKGNAAVNEPKFKSVSRLINDTQNRLDDYLEKTLGVARLVGSSGDGIANFLGLRGEKKYLILFENSQELRPGGGIISTYGLITIKNGIVSDIVVDHVQNLKELYALPLEANPAPIKNTMRHQKDMYIYDANWLVDSRDWLYKIFHSWNLQKTPVDGVIAVNTKFLEDVVRQYEPLHLPEINTEFRAENVVAALDYYFDVENELYDAGKYRVLTPLVTELLKKIRQSSPEQLKIILGIARARFLARDIALYTENVDIALALKSNGVSADLPRTIGDEFYALDVNLGSAKSDAVMKRELKMLVYAQKDRPFAKATVIHDFTAANEDFRTSGYYGYMRFALPEASTFGAFDGFDMVEDEKKVEAGRSVFGNYYSVATGAKKEQSISYGLAQSVAEQIKDGNYFLILRKQGGIEVPFSVKVFFPDNWKNPKINSTGGRVSLEKTKTSVLWQGVLTKDITLKISK